MMSATADTVDPLTHDERGEGADGARAPRHTVKGVVITLAGVAGVVGIVWFAASMLLGWSIIVFTTGSMSPTMPTGTAAVSERVPASALRVGDVVTVHRDGARLPITHRVVSIDDDPASSNFRMLVLRGDANANNDQFPYRVAEAQRVLFAVPGIGTVMAFVRTPFAMGAITVIIASLVMWAFWPVRPPVETRRAGES